MKGLAGVLVLLLLLVGCSNSNGPPSASSTEQAATPFAAVDPATTGSISGTVYLDGSPPNLPPINMQSEPACAKAHPSGAPAQAIVVGSNGAMANVVVYIKRGLADYRFEPPSKPAVLDQRNCTYQPRVIALMTNQPLQIRNSDPTIHNIHAMPKANTEWNKAQRSGAAVIETSFPRPELAIPFMCNVHPWMRAFVFVFDHPYFAVTAADGRFAINNLPPGTYTVEAWQEKLDTQTKQLTIRSRESKETSFRFRFRREGN